MSKIITDDEIQKIAKLSRIRLTIEEFEQMKSSLSSILTMINKLQEVDIENVEPMVSIDNSELHMRQDIVEVQGIEDEILANVPDDSGLAKEIKCFVVPKVVE